MTEKENRENFMSRCEWMSEEDRQRVMLAYILAKDAHRYQQRIGGERYFEHVRRTAIILMDELSCYNADMVCAALLHDVVEDTKHINLLFIGQFFGDRVAELVCKVTKTEDFKTNPDEYWLGVGGDADATVLKGCDRLDNVRSMQGIVGKFKTKTAKSTREHVLRLLKVHKKVKAAGILEEKIEATLQSYGL